MSGISSSDVFIPEVALDAIVAGVSDEGVKVLYGSPAVNVSPTLGDQGTLKVGRKLTIPYFGMIPKWQDDVPEGVALQPDKASETVEEAAMKRTGVAIEWSTWAEMIMRGRQLRLDPYTMFAAQALERLGQRFEEKLVTTAVTGLDSAYINEAPANASKTIDWDSIADTKQLLGDAARKIVMMSVHSKVKTDLVKLKDSVNRPMFVDAMSGTNEIPRLQGMPVFESDFNVKSSDVPAKYDSLLLQQGALALWHSMPTVAIREEPLSGTKQIVLWVYYIAYRYKSLPGGSKPGVLILRTR